MAFGEAMRLRSAAPILFLEALEDTTVAGVALSQGPACWG